MHLETLVFILGLLKGLEPFRRIGDRIGDSLINELLRRALKFDNPLRLTLEAEYKFKSLFGKLLFTWLSLVVSMVKSFCAVLFPTRCLG